MSPKFRAACAGLAFLSSATVSAALPAVEAEVGVPIVRSWVPPVYPREAAKEKRQGRVHVRFIIDEAGAVTKARALDGSDMIFADAAVQSVLQWRFEPAFEGDRKVAKCMDVWIPFDPTDATRGSPSTFPPGRITQTLGYSPQTPAAKLAADDPDYPDVLLSRHLPGRVVVEFTIDATGKMRGLRILAGTHTEFVQKAIAVLDRWTFQPAMQGDLPVPTPSKASLDFATFGTKSTDLLADNGVTLADDPAGSLAALDSRPSPLLVVDPVYPYELLIAGKEGEAEVEFVVRADGGMEAIAIRKATEPAFGRSLVAALECWFFEPARKGGEPTAVKASLRWHFGPIVAPGVDWPDGRLASQVHAGATTNWAPKGLDARPRPRFQVPPVYPMELRASGTAGTAEIEFVLDVDGRCRLARIAKASDERFGWAAATAVERWVFDPPTRGGKPVDVRFSIPFEFKPPE